jgi:hypothetical protein
MAQSLPKLAASTAKRPTSAPLAGARSIYNGELVSCSLRQENIQGFVDALRREMIAM